MIIDNKHYHDLIISGFQVLGKSPRFGVGPDWYEP